MSIRKTLLTCVFLLSSALYTQPAAVAQEAPVYLFEHERRLVILPFWNETGKKELDYLSTSIGKILSDTIGSLQYINVADPAVTFYVNPRQQSANRPGQENRSVTPARVAFSVLVPEFTKETHTIMLVPEKNLQAQKMKAHYLVTGRIYEPDEKEIKEHELFLEIELFDAMQGASFKFLYRLDDRTILRNLARPGSDVKNHLMGPSQAKILVKTEEPGARVYLDDVYLGRTPVDGSFQPGAYLLRVEQEGKNSATRRVELLDAADNEFEIALSLQNNSAGLRVVSLPEEAMVYLDSTYLGKTPLERNDLPPGTHRLRLSMEKHIDRFIGVKLENGKTAEIDAELAEGDTLALYRNPGYAIFDWTYSDLSFYCLITTLGWYGGWMYMTVRADAVEASIRPMVPVMAGFYELSLASTALASSAGNPALAYYYNNLLEKNRLEALRLHRYAKMSAGSGIFSLLLSGLFIYRYLALDGKETGEVGLEISPGTRFRFEPVVQPASMYGIQAVSGYSAGKSGLFPGNAFIVAFDIQL